MPKKTAWPDEKLSDQSSEIAQKGAVILREERRLELVDHELGDGESPDPDRVGMALRRELTMLADGWLRAARYIAWMHERMSYTEWVAWLDKWGRLSEWTGYRFLSVAQKFRREDMQVMKKLPISTMFEYFSCSEDDLEQFRNELKADGTILGHKIDKNDRLSIRSLCNDLRKNREFARAETRRADNAELRNRARDGGIAALQEKLGEPLTQLLSMIAMVQRNALEFLAKPDDPRIKSRNHYLLCQAFWLGFLGIREIPKLGEPMLPKEQIEAISDFFLQDVDKLDKRSD